MARNKPWETPMPMASQPISTSFGSLNTGYPTVEPNLSQSAYQQNMQRTVPQPPPRIQPQNVQVPGGIFGGGYGYAPHMGGYAANPYYGGAGYGGAGYGGAGSYFGSPRSLPTSNFAQLAVEESRNAFQSMDSVVQTFRSISLMLESTFTSVYSSFRAVTDVFDHFTRLRSQLTTIYPLIILWRFIKFLLNRILRLLRLRSTSATSPDMNESWSKIYDTLKNANQTADPTNTTKSSSGLLVALFFFVTFGTPMLMLHFLNSIIKRRQGNINWMQNEKSLVRAVALYDYTARNADELSFKQGTYLSLAPYAFQSTTSNWLLATVDRVSCGLIPANYIQVFKPNMLLSRPSSTGNLNNLTLHPQQPMVINNQQTQPSIPAITVNGVNSDTLSQQQIPLLTQDSMKVDNES